MTHTTPRLLAERIVDRILKSLDESTWKDENFLGYNRLLDYREDMIEDAEKEIVKVRS